VSEERPVLPVRLWWWLEDHLPGLLWTEQRAVHWTWAARHPAAKYRDVREQRRR
jgi:hypothetical protein